MAGIGGLLSGIGQGVGQFAQYWQQEQARKQQQQMLAVYLDNLKQQQQDRKDKSDAAAGEFTTLQGMSDLSGGLGGLGSQTAPQQGMPSLGGASILNDPNRNTPIPRETGGPGFPSEDPLALIRHYESGGNYNEGYGGADLSNAPKDANGFPIWSGKQGEAGMSHAAGAYQFQPATWAKYAASLGIKDFSPASQDAVARAAYQDAGFSHWAPYNPKLAAAIGGRNGGTPPVAIPGPPRIPGGTQAQAQGTDALPPQMQQQVQAGTQQVAGSLPPGLQSRIGLPQLAQQIEKAMPGASPLAKKAVLDNLAKTYLAPDQKRDYEVWKMQTTQAHQDELNKARIDAGLDKLGLQQVFAEKERGIKADAAAEAAKLKVENAQGQIMMLGPEGSQKPYRIVGGVAHPITMEGGEQVEGAVSRPGVQQNKGPPASEGEVDFWTNVLRSGGHLPPGLARTASGSQLVQQIMARMPSVSGADPGAFIENSSTVKADDRSLTNMTKMADAATSFEKTATRNFDIAMGLAKDAIPTDLGPFFNKWVETGQIQFGGENVPPYMTALMTAANEYAKVTSGSTGSQGSTVQARQQAAEHFSPYLSSGQIGKVVEVAKQEMEARRQSLYEQVDDIKGRLHSAGSGTPATQQGRSLGGGAGKPSEATAKPTPSPYKSAEDVVSAYREGKIDRDAAGKILRDNGWAQ